MKITLKQVQGVVLGNLMIIGLAACSSTPSPWSQEDESPWKSKRDAEAVSIPAEEFVEVPVAEVYAPEPVQLVEEPMAMPEPEPMPEPVVEPAPVGIMAMPPSAYAVQVYAGKTEDSVSRYQATHGLTDLMVVKTQRAGDTFYVLVSVHNDRASANQKASDLKQKTGSKPWVRSVSGLQQIAVE